MLAAVGTPLGVLLVSFMAGFWPSDPRRDKHAG